MIWFTSDLHFGHTNILTYCNRPFNNTQEMDETLLVNLNSLIRKDDTLYFLGDFAMPGRQRIDYALNCFNRITCKNKILIKGNHDSDEIINFNWQEVHQYLELKLPGKSRIILFHYPITEWNGYYHGSIHLHGHQHNNTPSRSVAKVFDVGVDAWNLFPVSLTQIEQLAETKENIPLKNI